MLKLDHYAEKDEKGTLSLIRYAGENYWADSEKLVFDVFTHITKQRGLHGTKLLDVGTGPEIRISRQFYPFFNIIGIEPDFERYLSAYEYVIKNDLEDNIELYNCLLEDLSSYIGSRQFETIVVSHIIQHLPRKTADEILSKVYEMLTPGGIALITTAHSAKNIDTYCVEADGKVYDNATEAQFEAEAVRGSFVTRRYSLVRLISQTEKLGFKVLDTHVFHITQHCLMKHDIIINRNPLAKHRFGLDLALILTK